MCDMEEVSIHFVTRVFTLDEANRSLVFVRAVAADIVHKRRLLEQYAHELKVHHERMRNSCGTDGGAAGLAAAQHFEEMDGMVNHLVDDIAYHAEELHRVGCVAKDMHNGIIDFPAQVNGQAIMWCWQLNEPTIMHWHGIEEGFSGRKTIASLAAAAAA